MEKTIFTLAKEKIGSYEKSIGELKARIANETKENLAKYEKKLAELEQKTSDMKKKLEEYKEEGKEKWDSYKLKFNHDMDELEKALKNFTVKSK
jgi:phage shock protein A